MAQLRHPAHIEPVDLDKDGLLDLLVADLGSFVPEDHHNGSIVLLRGQKNGRFVPTTHRAKGCRGSPTRAPPTSMATAISISSSPCSAGGAPATSRRSKTGPATGRSRASSPTVVDQRTGSIHVPIADVNGDGKPDFIALLAQEHEAVVAFVNNGKGLSFTPNTIYAAPHPNWGSSGIALVDLDKDGDLDVLLTHGDTFDDFVLKPYHGVQWLENDGKGHLREHALANLPGAQRAEAADVDGDGDLDVVATAMVAGGGGELGPGLASLVWLEQTQPRVFTRHTIEMGRAVSRHARSRGLRPGRRPRHRRRLVRLREANHGVCRCLGEPAPEFCIRPLSSVLVEPEQGAHRKLLGSAFIFGSPSSILGALRPCHPRP